MQADKCRRITTTLGHLGTVPRKQQKHADPHTLRWTFGSTCRCDSDAITAACASAASRAPRTVHQLRAEQGHGSYTYSAANPLSATIKSGDLIELQCWDSSEHDVLADNPTVEQLLDRTRPKPLGGWGNPVCDPVFVEGAEPGDTLQVEIIQLKSGTWGWTCITDGFGLLAGNDDGMFPEPKLGVWDVDHEKGLCTLRGCEGVVVPYRPMVGCVGVAPPPDAVWETGSSAMPGRGDMPAGHVSTGPPNLNGGNVDIKHITAGTTVFLPVYVKGAYFAVGDGHAAQGDGEVCGSAIETDMFVQARISVIKARSGPSIDQMQYITPGPAITEIPGPAFATTGVGPDLYVASQVAVKAMIKWLGETKGLGPYEAYMICSTAGDLKISEIVDQPNWVVSFHMPLAIFGASGLSGLRN